MYVSLYRAWGKIHIKQAALPAFLPHFLLPHGKSPCPKEAVKKQLQVR
jgi:hypothetical protein